jgi:hypothetical protein
VCVILIAKISAANITVYPGSSIQSAADQASNGDNITVYDNNSSPYTNVTVSEWLSNNN